MLDTLVIFDLDGTLIDSEPLYSQALIDLVPEINESLVKLTEMYKGKKLLSIIEDIELRYSTKLNKDFVDTYRKHEIELIKIGISTTPGSNEMLDKIPYKYCLASSAPMEKIKIALEFSGLGMYFKENIISSYDINSWKPEPGIFLFAAKYMNSNTENCIVIEDSDVGIQAAKSAKMKYLKYDPNLSVKYSDENHEFKSMSDLLEILQVIIRN
jgi:HAD superfamily hydrolase (TIGR01509 family)